MLNYPVQALYLCLLSSHDHYRFSDKVRHLLVCPVDVGHFEPIFHGWHRIPPEKFSMVLAALLALHVPLAFVFPLRRHGWGSVYKTNHRGDSVPAPL